MAEAPGSWPSEGALRGAQDPVTKKKSVPSCGKSGSVAGNALQSICMRWCIGNPPASSGQTRAAGRFGSPPNWMAVEPGGLPVAVLSPMAGCLWRSALFIVALMLFLHALGRMSAAIGAIFGKGCDQSGTVCLGPNAWRCMNLEALDRCELLAFEFAMKRDRFDYMWPQALSSRQDPACGKGGFQTIFVSKNILSAEIDSFPTVICEKNCSPYRCRRYRTVKLTPERRRARVSMRATGTAHPRQSAGQAEKL